MASCAPKQLGSCLPQIIPKLTEALSDSHPRVKEAGHASLHDIARVIRNPEIASISSVLLAGLQDPNRKTNESLQALQSMKFVHSIDSPSLALIMPILQRGLMDRVSETKKKAALIVGNMCSMINDAKDLVPYLDTISPCLQAQLLDPIPEVRTVASKALGMLVRGLGQSYFPQLVPSLVTAIKCESSSVERSGSAQGLCEVLVALGAKELDNYLIDEVFPIARHPKSAVREGVLWVVAFLPPALGKLFSKYLTKALPIIVSGLSDEAEGVRDVAMHAGSIVVSAHALSHTKDLLPSLESGIFDDNWRIRQSSISLLGDLLFRVSGTKAVAIEVEESDDEDSASSPAGEKAILKVLGKPRRDFVLASLYMVRSDMSAVVRQSALQVWKSFVSNTPKTLRLILETLMNVIVEALSGNNTEKQAMAGRTLGEIVKKLGDQVMPEVVPILRSGLSPLNSRGMRQGVCLGLAEVISCSPKKQLEDFLDTLVDALEEALCDVLPEVRATGGHAYEAFHKIMGYRAIDEIIPRLLKRIQSNTDAAQALFGLEEMLRVKLREVLSYLIPRLLTTPMTLHRLQVIAHIAKVSGSMIHHHIDRIMSVLFSEYVTFSNNDEMQISIQLSLQAVVLSVEKSGVQWLASEMCKYCDSDIVLNRYLALWLISSFCESTTTNYDEQVPIFLKYVLQRFNDSDASVVEAALSSFNSMNTSVRPDELMKHIDFIRNNLNSLVSDARHRKGGVGLGEFLLPALCLPKGLDPFLPAYLHALMNGSPDLRQSAAAGLGELVLLANAACLKSVIIKITGPLIRIAGDRFPAHVKCAILSTLEILLLKGGVALKPFLPQLQTTFMKALNDSSSEVRIHGSSALSQLVKLSSRIDPLFSELADKLTCTNGAIQESYVGALVSILDIVRDKISQPVLFSLQDSLRPLLVSEEHNVRSQACVCLSQVLLLAGAENGNSLFSEIVFGVAAAAWTSRHSSAMLCKNLLSLSSVPSWVLDLMQEMTSQLKLYCADEKVEIRSTALAALGLIIRHDRCRISDILKTVAGCLSDTNKDINRTALRVVKRMAKCSPEAVRPHLALFVPAAFQFIKSPNMGVKFAAERALLYLLEIHSRPQTLVEYSCNADEGKMLSEYARRVLLKLKAESDSNEE
jgi:HEAT repeat protein